MNREDVQHVIQEILQEDAGISDQQIMVRKGVAGVVLAAGLFADVAPASAVVPVVAVESQAGAFANAAQVAERLGRSAVTPDTSDAEPVPIAEVAQATPMGVRATPNAYTAIDGDTVIEITSGALGAHKDEAENTRLIVERNPMLTRDQGDYLSPGWRLNGLRVVEEGETIIDIAADELPEAASEHEIYLTAELFATIHSVERNAQGNPIIMPGDVVFTPSLSVLYEGGEYDAVPFTSEDTPSVEINEPVVEQFEPNAPPATDESGYMGGEQEAVELEDLSRLETSVQQNFVYLPSGATVDFVVRTATELFGDELPESLQDHTDFVEHVLEVSGFADPSEIPADAVIQLGDAQLSFEQTAQLQAEVVAERTEHAASEMYLPANLGEQLANGRYVMPESDIYEFSGPGYPLEALQVGTPVEFREGSLELIATTYGIAQAWNQETGTKIILGDLDAPEYHASHEFGVDVDFYLPESMYTNDQAEADAWFHMLKIAAAQPMSDLVFFGQQDVVDRYNEWAEIVGADMRVQYDVNHVRHIHLRIADEYRLDTASDARYGVERDIASSEQSDAPEASMSAYETALSLLSGEYHAVMEQKPSLATAIRSYDFPNTRDFGPQYTDNDTALLAYLGGFRGEDLRVAIALSVTPNPGTPGAESSNSPFVVNTSAADMPGFPEGTVAVGPMQMLFNPDWQHDPAESIRNPHENLDPIQNYKNAFELKNRQGWTVGWEAYRHDKHIPNLPKADQLIDWLQAQGLDIN